MYETEAKIRVNGSREAVVTWFTSIGFQYVDSCYEEDVYYTHPCRDFAETDEALRFRYRRCSSGDAYILTYKGPRVNEGFIKTRLELETRLEESQVKSVLRMLEMLGFTGKFVVRKNRVTLRNGGLTVSVDEVEDLGVFVEVEGKGIEPLLREVALTPWFGGFVGKTYLELMLEKSKV
ncbi:putative adenylyl cyclase CyaB [Thermogladius calderae 1633]|uniref:Putative adenylyl cyclase CyaB n=1 Tax=Thermogladius calderae (strain DSM 22663 / VKM B-2946 / 1633) TaxID=1184251 RepID=I3TE31_THEC1|nr:class IV adenylate cyclase [Thermogladius calderae]AFK51019.1 putative adenylyl cyclase CyaB [Thermogladius calderae 1633]